jgi:predicted ATP-grasp superfamily ATP-dependent carboligase
MPSTPSVTTGDGATAPAAPVPFRPPQTNPDRAEPDWPPAVVAGAFQTGVLGVRSLMRRGVRAVCFDCNPANSGFRSVYGPARLCPDPDIDSNGWLQFMLELAATFDQKPALIASSDQFVSAIARHRAVLATRYLLTPGIELQGLLADKPTQYALAAEHGMPMSRTRFATSEADVRAFAAEADFPCVIKPTHFREWRRLPAGNPLHDTKVAVVHSAEELLDGYRHACEISGNVIVQEIIAGPDTEKRVYLSVYDAGSRRIANAMFRELRCDPVGFGPATVTEPVVDPEVDDICDRFLRSIGYVGVCEIEMKRDTRDGRPKLIEANPRLSGGGDAAPYAGVDLCWLHYLDLIGRPVAPVQPSSRDFRHIVLRADARAAVAYWSAGLISWRDIVRSYRRPRAYFDFDAADWRYSLETFIVGGRLLVRQLREHMRQRGRQR